MPFKNPARILIIEDNPSDVQLLRLALDEQREAYLLEVFHDGEEAMRFIHEQRCASIDDPEPCVIVLDLHLPKYDGIAVLRALKTEPVLDHVKVIALTGLASPEEELAVRELGVSLYRTKPIELGAFMHLGQEILDVCRGHIAAAAG